MEERGSGTALVLELVEAFNAGDREAVAARLREDAEVRTIRSELEGRPYVGPEGFRRALEDWDEDWEFVHLTPGGSRERGPFVLLDVRVQAKGRASGVELDAPVWMLWELRDEEIVRIRSYSDRDEALAEAGIKA